MGLEIVPVQASAPTTIAAWSLELIDELAKSGVLRIDGKHIHNS